MSKIAVLGAGAWGTALAVTYANVNHDVRLWSFEASHVAQMRAARENARYLPSLPLPENIRIEESIAQAITDVDLVLLVTPVAGLRETLQRLQKHQAAMPVLWACKGFEAGTGLLPHEVVAQVLGADYPVRRIDRPELRAGSRPRPPLRHYAGQSRP